MRSAARRSASSRNAVRFLRLEEVARPRAVRRVLHVDLALGQTLEQLVRRQVDQHDLVGIVEHASGTVSRTRTRVMRWTTSLRLSRCWTFSVVQTSIPAASSSSMSCQRFGWRLPGAFVWAYSSTRMSRGWRSKAASRSNSCTIRPRYGTDRRGRISKPWSSSSVSWRPWVSTRPTMTCRALLARRPRGLKHGIGLPDAGRRPEKDPEAAAPLPVGQGEQCIRRGTRRLGQGHEGLRLRRVRIHHALLGNPAGRGPG